METGEMLKEICKRLSDVESDISEINYKNSDTDKNLDKIADDLIEIERTDRETALFYLDKLKGTEYFDDIIKKDYIAKLYSGTENKQHSSPDITNLKDKLRLEKCVEMIGKCLGMTETEVLEHLGMVGGYIELDRFLLEKLAEEWSKLTQNKSHQQSSIPDLKKRIKYCKNPLEKKSLQRELNVAHKNRKRGRV